MFRPYPWPTALALVLTPALWAETPGAYLQESWDAAYLRGTKIGYIHTRVDRVDAGGQAVIHTRQTSVLSIRRFEDETRIGVVSDSFELPDGQLYAVDERIKMAGQERRTRGILADGQFHLTVEAAGSKETSSIDWPENVLGPYAFERVLREEPLSEGEERTFTTFEPTLNVVTESTLKAVGKENTELQGGKSEELLLVKLSKENIPVVMSLWVNDDGDMVKGLIPMSGLDIVTYRVSKAEALDQPKDVVIDLGFETLVRPEGKIEKPHALSAARYLLVFKDGSAKDVIPEANYQKAPARSDAQIELLVERKVPPKDAKVGEPGEEFIGPNGFIQSDDPKIVEIATRVTANVTDPWQKALLLERWVDQNMSNADFTVGFASASEVVNTLRGDCTEHSVLLAAFCRAVGVPSRVAMGLVFIEGANAFGYHMWTEVNIGGEWYALDGTLGQGGIGAGHIKVADASLKGASAIGTFLPIVQLLGNLEIRVLETMR